MESVSKAAFKRKAVAGGLSFLGCGTIAKPRDAALREVRRTLATADFSKVEKRRPVRSRSFGIERETDKGWSRLELGKYSSVFLVDGFWVIADNYPETPDRTSVIAYS